MTMQRVNKRHSQLAARAEGLIPKVKDAADGDTPVPSSNSSSPQPTSAAPSSVSTNAPISSSQPSSSASPHTPTPTPTPTPTFAKPTSTSDTSKTSTPNTPPPVAPAESSTSSPSSTTSSSFTSSSSVSSTSNALSTDTTLSTNKAVVPVVASPTAPNFLPASSFFPVTPTTVDPAPTVSAGALTSETGSSTHGGAIVGGVLGSLAGIAVLGFIVVYLIRQVRRNRRRALHNSDFGTFNRSAFVTEKPIPEVQSTGHNVAPSISSIAGAGVAGFGSAAATTEATPPSQALANANAAAAASLQERPKYVYGQPPEVDNATQQPQAQVDEATGAAYASDAHTQANYSTDAYGGSYAQYAQYADASADVIGGAGYQDAQREYQGQQGYDATQAQATYYDQSGYAVSSYDQQTQQGYYNQQAYATDYTQAQYDYSQQQQTYDATQYMQTQHYQADAQAGYQAPHPYATNGAPVKTDAAYGGM